MGDNSQPSNQIVYGVDIYGASHALLTDPDGNFKVSVWNAGLTDLQLRATPISVTAVQSGTWTVNLATNPTIEIGTVDQGKAGTEPWPVVVSNASATQTFSRILSEQLNDNEEARIDLPQTFDRTFSYVGVALAGSSTSSSVWAIVRESWINNRKTRVQFQNLISWDNRALDWN